MSNTFNKSILKRFLKVEEMEALEREYDKVKKGPGHTKSRRENIEEEIPQNDLLLLKAYFKSNISFIF